MGAGIKLAAFDVDNPVGHFALKNRVYGAVCGIKPADETAPASLPSRGAATRGQAVKLLGHALASVGIDFSQNGTPKGHASWGKARGLWGKMPSNVRVGGACVGRQASKHARLGCAKGPPAGLPALACRLARLS